MGTQGYSSRLMPAPGSTLTCRWEMIFLFRKNCAFSSFSKNAVFALRRALRYITDTTDDSTGFSNAVPSPCTLVT